MLSSIRRINVNVNYKEYKERNYTFKGKIVHLLNSEPIFQYLPFISAALLILIDFYFLVSTVFILIDFI